MKIGVFGGTFNPVHMGHIRMAQAFRNQLDLDRLLLIPANIPPHKAADGLVAGKHRLAMCRLAAAGQPGMEVCDYELRQPGKSFTYKTLLHLHETHPDSQFYLIMGTDMFLTVQDWKEPERIFRLAVLCAAQRGHEELARLEAHCRILEQKGATCALIDMDPMPLSSTEVREYVQSGGDLSGLLHPRVMDYIRAHGLYRKEGES